MRFIYIDEAGISAPEPMTVVVALVVHADEQWRPAYELVQAALSKVPEHYRSDFVFHATSIWGNPKYRDGWELESRLALLHEMMSIPQQLGIPIAIGVQPRLAAVPKEFRDTPEKYHHIRAFSDCIACADLWMSHHAGADEIATVVAEDIPEMRARLNEAVAVLQERPIFIPARDVLGISGEYERKITKDGYHLTVKRMVDVIHFVEKGRAPLLLLADACAFGLRRFCAQQTTGIAFAKSILGSNYDDSLAEIYTEGTCGYVTKE